MEFEVSEILDGDIVAGRNGKVDIPVGTVFTKITKYKVTGDTSNLQKIELSEVEAIKLTLKSVSWYGREVEYIPGGHTAGLKFAGDGLSLLKEEINKLEPREYVHIKA
jgi:hypothetical protein